MTMLKSTIVVTLFSILGIVINFVTQLLLAYYFGASSERDVYFAALTVPAYITTLFTGSIGMVLLPYLVNFKKNHNEKQSDQFVSVVINCCLLILAGIILVGYVFAGAIMQYFTPRSAPLLSDMGIYLFRIQIFSVFFTVSTNLLIGLFQANNSFLVPAAAPVITSLTSLLFVTGFASFLGIKSIALGTLTGTALSFAFTLVLVKKQFNYNWSGALSSPGLKSIFWAAAPLFAAGIVFRSYTIFERLFAARLPEGSLSYLGSGNQIILILSTIVSSGIATTSFPLLSRYWHEKDLQSLEEVFTKVVSLIVMIVLPLVVIFVISGRDIIKILFEHGAFSAKDSAALYVTLLALMGYFLFGSIGNVSAKMLYLSQNTNAAALIGLLELLAYIVSAVVLIRFYQFVGLALSMSLGAALNTFITFLFIKKKIIGLNIRSLLMRVGRLLFISVLLLFVVLAINRYYLSELHSVLKVLIAALLVLSLYWFMVFPTLKKIRAQPVVKILNG